MVRLTRPLSTMRAAAFLLVCLSGALALPATQGDSVSCTSDALFTSLSRDGRDFCSSVVEGRCHQGTTPTQYATYEPSVISKHVSRGCRAASSTPPLGMGEGEGY